MLYRYGFFFFVYRITLHFFVRCLNNIYINIMLPNSDNRPQATQMTRHIPTDPVFFNALPAETKIPDPVRTDKKNSFIAIQNVK
jgi:hypothetical protein